MEALSRLREDAIPTRRAPWRRSYCSLPIHWRSIGGAPAELVEEVFGHTAPLGGRGGARSAQVHRSVTGCV